MNYSLWVLTSSDNLAMLDEKQRKKAKELQKKEEKQRQKRKA